MVAYYTPNDGFTANDASFYKSKVGQLDYTAESLQSIVEANVPFFAVMQQKGTNRCKKFSLKTKQVYKCTNQLLRFVNLSIVRLTSKLGRYHHTESWLFGQI